MKTRLHPLVPAVTTALALLAAGPAIAEGPLKGKPETDQQKFSYSLGFRIGSQIASQSERDDIKIDADALNAAIRDALDKKEPRMKPEEMQAAMKAESDRQRVKREAAAKTAVEDGKKFQAEFAKQDGVKKTESGLLYKVVKAGEGAKPKAADTVVVNYEGTLIDGSVFDSSYKRGQPATFGVGRVIPGWQEVLKLMSPGANYEVVIPPKLAYGERGSGAAIPPNSTLKFKVELVAVKPAGPAPGQNKAPEMKKENK